MSKFIDSFCEDLKLRLRNMHNSKYVWKGEGLEYRLLATNKKYKELDTKELGRNINKSKNILVLLGFDGTLISKNAETVVMINEGEVVKMIEQPTKSLIKNLESLACNPRIHIFIMTHHNVKDIDYWLGNKSGLGLCAENGYCYKMPYISNIEETGGMQSKGPFHDDFVPRATKNSVNNLANPSEKQFPNCIDNPVASSWENLCDLDWSWTKMVKEIMANYVKRIEGSYIESRKSGIQWKYNETGDKLNHLQEKALEEHLFQVLEPFDNIEVVSGRGYIEVKPYGMSKGAFAQLLIR